MKLSRRKFLTLAAGCAVGLLGVYALFVEPERVTVTRHVMGSSPGGGRPVLRLAHLSDLHLQRIGSHERRIASVLAELKPDLIVLTGDIIDRQDRLPVLPRFLDLLDAKTPMVAILGNREYYDGLDRTALRKAYESHHVRLLVNESVRLTHHGRPVLITGLDDATAGCPDIRGALRGFAPEPNHLLLAHSPSYRDRVQTDALPIAIVGPGACGAIGRDCYTVSCMLSGHTHGGQVAPFGVALVLPPGNGRYVSGWYRNAPIPLYVSRGLGTTLLPFRLGAPPEIALFQWYLD
jgi:predicted MPP superfamily phosphohydrolase